MTVNAVTIPDRIELDTIRPVQGPAVPLEEQSRERRCFDERAGQLRPRPDQCIIQVGFHLRVHAESVHGRQRV